MNLLVNIDHIATLRNARGEGRPDPVEGARLCEEAGAKGIVFHLREDRRHIKDEDVYALVKMIKGVIDFEMAATDEMLDICTKVKPHVCTLVPESRQELTTEGGLPMAEVFEDFKTRVYPPLKAAGVEISLFIDPVEEDVRLAAELGSEAIELHTGPYANAQTEAEKEVELDKLAKAATLAYELGMKINAGHGLDFENIHDFMKRVPHVSDISIGHALMSDALFNGLPNSVKRMCDIIHNFN